MERSYLDHNATSPLRPEVRAAMIDAFDEIGNPSSVHQEGRSARGVIEKARDQVAELVGGVGARVTFTSGASEANMLALTPNMKREYNPDPATALYMSAVEHPSVLAGGRFEGEVCHLLPVSSAGVVDLGQLEFALANHDQTAGRAMIAVMAVNSETGVIQPMNEIGELARKHNAYFHVDAVQAAGRIDLDIQAIGCSSLSLSAHKIGGPKGVGALVMADEGCEPEPLITGGPQENRVRAGTENVTGIVGFGVACQCAKAAVGDQSAQEGIGRLRLLRDQFETELRALVPDVEIFGSAADRVGNSSQFALPGLRGETLLIQLDLGGVAVSSGSACSSGKVAASHVLTAMGYESALAGSAIRMSLGWSSDEGDIMLLLDRLKKICVKNSKKAG